MQQNKRQNKLSLLENEQTLCRHFTTVRLLSYNYSLGPKAAIGYDTKKNSYTEKEIKTEELHTPEKKWRKKNLES